ncbi:MAG: hypothetical protein ACNY01_06265 [Desulfobacteria bacterium]
MRGKKGKTSSLAIAELARVSFMLWTASAWGNVTQLGTGVEVRKLFEQELAGGRGGGFVLIPDL